MTYIRDHQGDDWLFLYCYYQSCTCPSLGWVCLYKNNDIKNTLPLSFTRSLKIIAQIKILTSVPYHPEPCLPSLASSQTHNQFQNCINNIQGPPWPGTSLHNRITEPLLLRPSCRVIRSQPVNLLPVHISNPQLTCALHLSFEAVCTWVFQIMLYKKKLLLLPFLSPVAAKINEK